MKKKKLLLIGLLLFPQLCFASSGTPEGIEGIISAYPFLSIFYLVIGFAILNEIMPDKKTKGIIIVLLIRAGMIALYFIPYAGFFIDFFGVYFIAIALSVVQKKTRANVSALRMSVNALNASNNENDFYRCERCSRMLSYADKVCPGCGEPTPMKDAKGVCAFCHKPVNDTASFCPYCGRDLSANDAIILTTDPKIETIQILRPVAPQIYKKVEYATRQDYDTVLGLPEATLVRKFIDKEIDKIGRDKFKGKIPKSVNRKRTIISLIFSILLFLFVFLLFFHLNVLVYIISIAILLILLIFGRRFDLYAYFTKELKARPNEKISNIVIGTTNDLVKDTSKFILIAGFVLSIAIPCVIFVKPRAFYEELGGGYSLRFYTLGLTDNKKVEIPSTYNGKPVISIRGNVFKNMYLLEEVVLPDTITEIRGQAFKNDWFLTKVKLPEKLEYLGGGSFENCASLRSITIPNTVTEMGGEVFKEATSLKEITLSENLTEIRGNSFENCSSLVSIVIPDKVTRIGGHAFYGNKSLSNVTISEKSQLQEIGSSAFRQCDSLYSITLPNNVSINERAFKESPTTIYYHNVEGIDQNIIQNTDVPKETKIENYGINGVEEEVKEEPIKVINTNETNYRINPNTITNFNTLNTTIEYPKLTSDKIAHLKINFNGNTINVDYSLKEKIMYYHAINGYTIEIFETAENELAVYINKMAKLGNGFNYYINSANGFNDYKIKSDIYKDLNISVSYPEDIEEKHYITFNISGDINEKVDVYSGDTKTYGNLGIRVADASSKSFHSYVFYLK